MEIGESTKEVSKEDVLLAIKDLVQDKAPGLNGFMIVFYNKFWNIIKGDIINIVKDLFSAKVDLQHLNYATVMLIPKKEEEREIRDFRPISLTNGIVKI